MKTLYCITFLLTFCISLVLNAQPYSNYLDSTSVWYEHSGGGLIQFKVYFKTYFIDGDTSIAGKDYFIQKLNYIDSTFSGNTLLYVNTGYNLYAKAIREDSIENSFYVVYPNDKTEVLIADFSISDTAFTSGPMPNYDTFINGTCPVFSVDDTLEFNNDTIKVYSSVSRPELLEGIGYLYNSQCGLPFEGWQNLVAYSQQNDTLTVQNYVSVDSFLPKIPFQILTDIQNVSCFAANNGAVSFSNANNLPFDTIYVMNSNWDTLSNYTNLEAGAYFYHVLDQYSNSAYFNNFIIEEPDTLTLSYSAVDDTNSMNIGAVLLTINGGTGNYTINWSNGSMDSSLTNLSAGAYEVTVVDENQCTVSTAVDINNVILTLNENFIDEPTVSLSQFPGNLNIQASAFVSHLSIINLNGSVVFLSDVNAFEYTIQTNAFHKGAYFLKINFEENICIEKVGF